MSSMAVPDTLEPVAEIQLERARAVRALMATGADRATAQAAVAEQWRHAVSDPRAMLEANMAVTVDAWTGMARYACEVLMPQWAEAARQVGAALASIGRAMQRHDMPGPPGHATPNDDRWAVLIEQKRAGVGAGPGAPRMDGRKRR